MISESELPLTIACETIGVNRNCYYRNNLASNVINLEDFRIKKVIEKVILKSSGYGYRRVTKTLQRNGENINHKKVYRIMSENNILVKKKKKFKIITTDSNHNLPIYKNLIKDLEVIRLNQIWVADLTYIHLPKDHI